MTELIRRSALREGLQLTRRRKSTLAFAIMFATARKWLRIFKDAWNHDAIIVRDPKDGELKVGDALSGPGCVLTPISEWEADCVANGTKIMVLQIVGATPEHEKQAARWWLENVFGRAYDKVGIRHLAVEAIFGDWIAGKVGMLDQFFCTEGVHDAVVNAIRIVKALLGIELADPWGDTTNPTPGTTHSSWKAGKFEEVPNSLTAEGRKYALSA